MEGLTDLHDIVAAILRSQAPAPGDEPKADIRPKASEVSSASEAIPAVDPEAPKLVQTPHPANELRHGRAGGKELTGAGLSGLLIEHPRRRRDASHLKFVAEQPCLICSRTPSDPHHLRFAQPQAMAKKVSDEYTVPLCRTHHRQLHQTGNELNWWIDLDVDPLPIAQQLWDESHGKSVETADKAASKSNGQ